MVEVTQNEKAVEDILKERSEHVQKWKMGSAVILSNIPPLEVAMLLQESRHQAKVYTASGEDVLKLSAATLTKMFVHLHHWWILYAWTSCLIDKCWI